MKFLLLMTFMKEIMTIKQTEKVKIWYFQNTNKIGKIANSQSRC